jgi:hypothetical protein
LEVSELVGSVVLVPAANSNRSTWDWVGKEWVGSNTAESIHMWGSSCIDMAYPHIQLADRLGTRGNSTQESQSQNYY